MRPSGAGCGNVNFEEYTFILDIHCQQLGNIGQLNIYICIVVLDIFCQQLGDIWQLEGVCAPFRALGWGTCVSWIYIYIFVLDIFCQQLGDIWHFEGVCAPFGRWVGKYKKIHSANFSAVPNCPFLHMVPNCPRCQIVLVPNCPVPNCPRCQIVRGAKLSGAKLSWCQIVRQHGRCQIVRGAKLSWCQIVLGPSKVSNLSPE